MSETIFNVMDFGAMANNETDDTSAIQKAIDKAGTCGGVVMIPPGTYKIGMLKIPANISLIGYPSWSYRDDGGSILMFSDPTAKCCIDMRGGFGSTIKGLCINGQRLGEGIHGVSIDKEDYDEGGEDTPRIEDCKIGRFTGNGIHLNKIWCFSIRHNMVCHNKGHGLYIDGWDGFILDNWFSGNRGAGMCGDVTCASCTITGNRVEWNSLAGFYLKNSNSLNITGNYFDRSGGPGIALISDEDGRVNNNITIVGNVIYRSGKPRGTAFVSPYENSQIWMDYCVNVLCTSNTLLAGKDDGGKGEMSPDYGIVYGHMKNCIIKDNLMQNGSLKQSMLDLGGHKANVCVENNLGEILKNPEKGQWFRWDNI